MLKMIAAIIGINFLIEHPYIALGLVCAIGYLIYWGIQQKNNQDNAEAAPAPQNISDAETNDILESLLTGDKKMSELLAWQRDKIVDLYDIMCVKIVSGNIPKKEADAYSVLIPRIRNKIYEFQYSVDPSIMTDKERQRMFGAIDHLNGEKQKRALTEEENTRLGLLSMKKFQYQTRGMTPDDRTVYLRLIGKYMSGEGLTAEESKQFDRLRAIADGGDRP